MERKYRSRLELGGNCEALQLEGRRTSCQWTIVLGFHHEVHNAPAYKCNTSSTSFGLLTKISSQERTDILAIVGNLPALWPYFHCVCAETAISELPVKILTSQLDSVTQVYYKRAIIWRSDKFSGVFFPPHRSKICQIFIFVVYDLMILNKCQMLRLALG